MARMVTGPRSKTFRTKAGFCKRMADGKVLGPFITLTEAANATGSVKKMDKKVEVKVNTPVAKEEAKSVVKEFNFKS